MAPYLLALLLLAQDASAPAPAPAPAPADGPVATAVARKQDVAPLPIQGGPAAVPTDDYGYVGWCYGALAGYVDLYDRAMPDVERIERAWPTPSTEENIKIVYPGQQAEAKATLPLLRKAMEAAEKASPTPIQNQGAEAIKKGRAVWTGATTVPTAQLAQFWMSWTPPAKCEDTAKTLEARSNLFGQALSFNTPESAPAEAAPPEVEKAEGADVAAAPSAIDALVPETTETTETAEPPPAESSDETSDAAKPEETPPLRGPQ